MLETEKKAIQNYFNGIIDLCLGLMLEEASNNGETPEEMTDILGKRLKEELRTVLELPE